MKNLIPVCFLLFIGLSSCDDELTLFDQDFILTKTFDVSIPEGGPLEIQAEKEFNIDDEPDLEPYIDRIEDITINEISYSITNYVGDEDRVLESATFNITSESGTVLGSTAVSNVKLSDLNDAGDQILTFEATEFETIQATLKDDRKLDFVLSGNIDAVPVEFDLKLNLDVTVEYRIAENN